MDFTDPDIEEYSQSTEGNSNDMFAEGGMDAEAANLLNTGDDAADADEEDGKEDDSSDDSSEDDDDDDDQEEAALVADINRLQEEVCFVLWLPFFLIVATLPHNSYPTIHSTTISTSS